MSARVLSMPSPPVAVPWRVHVYEEFIREIRHRLDHCGDYAERNRDLALLQGWIDLRNEWLEEQLRRRHA